jgi:SAM-dependent methyltransferase
MFPVPTTAILTPASVSGHPGSEAGCPTRFVGFPPPAVVANEVMSEPGPDGASRPTQSIDDFDASYAGTPPWDIGRPQPAFLRLADAGLLQGRVLDAGCGTGEHVLLAAERGHEATGIDAAPHAIAIAEQKANDRGVGAHFLVRDALRLDELDEHFRTVLDSGLFHVFDDESRARYVAALGSVLEPGGHYFMCCFSDRQPGDWGPRRVHQEEIRAAFASGWTVESIEPVRFDTNLDPPFAEAWLAQIIRR